MAGDPRTVLIANPGADLYGSDRMTVESVKALVAAGYRVFVTVPGPGPLIDLLTDAGATVLEQPTPVIRKSLLSPRGLFQLLQDGVGAWLPSWRLLRRTNAGTVMVNTITAPLWFPLARLAGRTTACHLHEAESMVSAPVRWAMYLPLQFCHHVVANSRFTKHVLAGSSLGLTGRTVVVRNTVPGPERPEPARPVLEGPVKLLYVGRLSARKGIHVVVSAMQALRDRGLRTHLDIVGAVFPGNESYEKDLRDQIDALDLARDVTFHGFQHTVWSHLANCDIAVVPAVEVESFGNTAVEASLAGRPVVVSEIAGLREATSGSEAAVLVPPGDPRALADAIERVAAGWADYLQRARVDADRAAQTYSPAVYGRGITAALGLER